MKFSKRVFRDALSFKEWYHTTLEGKGNLKWQVMLCPNQHLSGTFLFQDKSEFQYILEIYPKIDRDSFLDISNYFKVIIENSFKSIFGAFKTEFLLFPFHNENKVELNKIKE